MKSLRIAVLGGGHLGRIHTRLLKTNPAVEVVGVSDPMAPVREQIAQEFSVPTCADYHELLGHIDAAIVATPTPLHHGITRDLLQNGIHALVEKPVTVTTAEANDLVALAKQKQLVLQVGHVERFNPAFVAVRSSLAAPRYLEAVRSSGYTFRSTDVGVVLDLMIHDLDLILSLVESPVVDVEAVGTTVVGPHEDVAHARLRFANGCLANLHASRVSHQPQRSLQITTSREFVQLDFAAGTAQRLTPDARLAAGAFEPTKLSAQEKNYWKENFFQELLKLENVAVEKRNAIQDEQADFVRAIQTATAPQVTGAAGRDALSVAQQILDQIAANQSSARPTVPFSGPAMIPQSTETRRAG